MQVLASIVFLRLHPKPLRHTPSYEFTTSFAGVCWGIVGGMSRQHLMYQQNMPGRFMQIIQSRAGVVALIQRITIGQLQNPPACLFTRGCACILVKFSLFTIWLLATFTCDRQQRVQCVCSGRSKRQCISCPHNACYSIAMVQVHCCGTGPIAWCAQGDSICSRADLGSSLMCLRSCQQHVTHACRSAGFVLVIVMKPLSKQIIVTFLPLLYLVVPVSLRKLWQPPLHSLKPPKHEGIPVDEHSKPWDVAVTARFISYASIGWTVVDLAPVTFNLLHLTVPVSRTWTYLQA